MKKIVQKKRGVDYEVAYNPEFLRQNSALDDFFSPDRVIIGEEGSNELSKLLVQLYEPLTKIIISTSFEAAELIKYASNCFLSLKISFFNEIGMICKHLGIDDKVVSLGVSLDKRIGKYGTEFGRPFDGMCLPKDTQALASFIKQNRIEPDLLEIGPEHQQENRRPNKYKTISLRCKGNSFLIRKFYSSIIYIGS